MSKDIRWSFDPRTEELFIWDSEEGRVGHFEKFGAEGFMECSQGRILQVLTKGVVAMIYGDRPLDKIDGEKIREQAQATLEAHYAPKPVHWQLSF